MRCWLAMAGIGIVGLMLLSAQAQPGKTPMFPPINRAIAEADIILTGLDGPGFAIAYGGDAGPVVGCKDGTLQTFKKDTFAAFKAGTGKAEICKGHQGPMRCLAWIGGRVLASAASI